MFGPTGIGKSTLLKQFYRKCAEDYRLELEKATTDFDAGHLPVILLTVPAFGDTFDWKLFYLKWLKSLYDPVIDRKVNYSKWETMPSEVLRVIGNSQSTIGAYRNAVEKALINRKVRTVLIDEAHHISKVASGRTLQNQLDIIKSIAQETETRIILCGTYELLNFMNLGDQVARRSTDIHFQRYFFSENETEDTKNFRNVIWQFQNYLPLNETPDLLDFWDYLYERSLGCIGILYDWLEKTLRRALRNKRKTLTLKDFENTQHSDDKCITIMDQIELGEKLLAPDENKVKALRLRLGMLESRDGEPLTTANQKKIAHKKGNLRPGEQNPNRKPVGVAA